MNYPESFLIHDKLAVRRIYRAGDGTDLRYQVLVGTDEFWTSAGDFLLKGDDIIFDNAESEENLKGIKEHIEKIFCSGIEQN